MKKIASVTTLILAGLMILSGCSGKSNKNMADLENKSEYMTLGQYIGIEVKQSDIDAGIASSISTLQSSKATTESVTDRAAKMTDTVNIDYVGKVQNEEGEWVEFENGSDTAYDLTLGSGSFITGFEEAIAAGDFKVGDEKDIDVTFPDPYTNNTELSGKPAKFTVKINSITGTVTPEVTDDFVKENTDFETVEAYKESLVKEYKQSEAWSQALSNAAVHSYPAEYVQQYYDNMVSYYQAYATQYGVTFATFCSSYMGSTEDAVLANILSSAKNTAKQQLLVYLIAEKENITVTDEEYAARIDAVLADYAGSYETVEELEEEVGKDTIRAEMLQTMVKEYLGEKVVVVEDAADTTVVADDTAAVADDTTAVVDDTTAAADDTTAA